MFFDLLSRYYFCLAFSPIRRPRARLKSVGASAVRPAVQVAYAHGIEVLYRLEHRLEYDPILDYNMVILFYICG